MTIKLLSNAASVYPISSILKHGLSRAAASALNALKMLWNEEPTASDSTSRVIHELVASELLPFLHDTKENHVYPEYLDHIQKLQKQYSAPQFWTSHPPAHDSGSIDGVFMPAWNIISTISKDMITNFFSKEEKGSDQTQAASKNQDDTNVDPSQKPSLLKYFVLLNPTFSIFKDNSPEICPEHLNALKDMIATVTEEPVANKSVLKTILMHAIGRTLVDLIKYKENLQQLLSDDEKPSLQECYVALVGNYINFAHQLPDRNLNLDLIQKLNKDTIQADIFSENTRYDFSPIQNALKELNLELDRSKTINKILALKDPENKMSFFSKILNSIQIHWKRKAVFGNHSKSIFPAPGFLSRAYHVTAYWIILAIDSLYQKFFPTKALHIMEDREKKVSGDTMTNRPNNHLFFSHKNHWQPVLKELMGKSVRSSLSPSA